MGVRSYRELKVWQRGMALAGEIHVLAQSFPKHELFGLGSQIQRASVSIPSNIAEGQARDSTKEFLRHLAIACGSLAELETQVELALQFKYCKPPECDELSRMLASLQRALRRKLRPRDH